MPYEIPVSQDWRKEWRRNGGGLMTVAAAAAAAYISACQTFVVLSNGKLTHPSWWSWPFWVCLIIAGVGIYAFLASYHDELPFLGRERTVDHSTKYSLGLQGVNLTIRKWTDDSPEPERLDARIALVLVNGNNDRFLRAYLEKMDVEISGIKPESNDYSCREIRILPRNSRFFWSPFVMNIPVGDNVIGQVSYSIIYGPPSGFPAYRRTHKIVFRTHGILNREVTNLGGTDWQDLEAEADEDLPDGAPPVSEPQQGASVLPAYPTSGQGGVVDTSNG